MLGETIEELRSVALAADDASGHFPAMYARVTQKIQAAVESGKFGDGVGMVQFAGAFAGWYLRPRAGTEPIPGSWRAAWAVGGDRRLLIVQHLLLGINAHVNHDLAQAVVEVADERGNLSAMRDDFNAVNAVLSDTMPEVLRDLGRASRWVNIAAARGGGQMFDFSLAAARDQAWRFARRTYPLTTRERAREAAVLDDLVRALAYMITTPGRPARWLLPVGRWLETDDPRQVTRDLLGPLA